MKTILNQNLVLKFSIEQKPSLKDGVIIYSDNPTLTPYIVFDEHRDAPVGFGVKIAKTKKTYIVQKRVSYTKVIKAKVGNVRDFAYIELARTRAREMIGIASSTKRNPNELSKEKDAGDITLSEAFSNYRSYLLGKAKPAKINTLKVFDSALKRLDKIKDKKISDISGHEVLKLFDVIADKHRTAAEQTFRWANVSTKLAIQMAEHQAAQSEIRPTLHYNPFQILTVHQKFRSSSQLEQTYQEKGIRKPLSLENMGAWLNHVIKRRERNRTGCDYLLLTTLWGSRKNEALSLKWRNLIDDKEAASSSWVCLKTRNVHFFDTKNRANFDIPIADAAYEILIQRYELSHKLAISKRLWVFPAEKKHSKSGHYTEMKTLVKNICTDADITPIRTHDLRRSFGRIAEQLVSYAIVKKLLNHRDSRDVTERYTEPDPLRLIDGMQKIELHILKSAPDVYNLLLPAHYQLKSNDTTEPA